MKKTYKVKNVVDGEIILETSTTKTEEIQKSSLLTALTIEHGNLVKLRLDTTTKILEVEESIKTINKLS